MKEPGWASVDRPEPFCFEPAAGGAFQVSIDRGFGAQLTDWLVALRNSEPELAARPTVVFLDTLARAVTQVGGASYGADVAAVSALTELAMLHGRDLGMDVASVLIHHTNKGAHEDAQGALAGTNGIAGSVSWDLTIYRDIDKETKARLQTGRLVGPRDGVGEGREALGQGFLGARHRARGGRGGRAARRPQDNRLRPPREELARRRERARRSREARGRQRAVGHMLAKYDAYLAEAGVVRDTWRGGSNGKRYQSLKYCGPGVP